MRGQPGFFDVDERLKELSSKGDAPERLKAIVDFELFRPDSPTRRCLMLTVDALNLAAKTL